MNKTKTMIMGFALLVGLGVAPLALTTPAGAALKVFEKGCSGASSSEVCSDTTAAETAVGDIINLLFYAIGVIAVIVIIVGGIKYVTSDGDSSKIKGAKDTILYAVVGLIVAILSFAIVNFILGRF